MRQEQLNKSYHFDCDCDRCRNGIQAKIKLIGKKLALINDDDNGTKDISIIDVNIDQATSAGAQGTRNKYQELYLGMAEKSESLAASYAIVDNTIREREELARTIEIKEQFLHPLHTSLYQTRGVSLSSALACGDMKQALEDCRHTVAYLEATLSHVPNHPLLALQYFTLADLEDSFASSSSSSSGRMRALCYLKKSLKMLELVQGQRSNLVQAARMRIHQLEQQLP